MKAKLREYTEGLERLVDEKTCKLVEAERLAAVGQTVATLAHAIKNIIGGLSKEAFTFSKRAWNWTKMNTASKGGRWSRVMLRK